MSKQVSRFSVLAIALLLVSPTFLLGQGIVTGTISGTVVDPQGAVVSGATVNAKDVTTNREFTTTSDETGAFAIRGVPVGTYALTIEAPNFKKVQVASVQVFANRTTALGARILEIGGAGEVVDVEGTAPLVEATSSQVSTSFETKKVSELPVGANTGFDALALLTPGVAQSYGGSDGFSNTNGAELSANGQRGRSNNFQIDGQANNDNSVAGPQLFMSNTDTIAEFQVITNNFSAEYGRNMGSVVNYVTKSGTNNFHGTTFWYHRNGAFHSLRNQDKSPLPGFVGPNGLPFCTSGETPCDEPQTAKYVDNRYGLTLGGPVVVDRLWFFGSFQHNSIYQGSEPVTNAPFLTPTPAGMATLNAAFPGNPAVEYLNRFGAYSRPVGNPTPIDPVVLPVVGPGGVPANVEFASVGRQIAGGGLGGGYAQRDWTGRVDWQMTDKDRVFVRYLFQGANTPLLDFTGLAALGYLTDVPARTNQVGFDWSRSWTSRFINQVRWSYSRAVIGFEGSKDIYPDCNTGTILECPAFVIFFDDTEWLGYANNLPQGRNVNNTQFQDNASWVLGRHTVKFGGEYVRQRSPNTFLPNINGTYQYFDFSSFLQGDAWLVNLADDDPGFTFKEQDLAFYFQDDWRIQDNLTLNLGLRWEWNEQAINALHERTLARETGSAPFWNPALPLEERIVAEVPEDRNNFGPNFGFAWTPRLWEGLFGRDKTVIRGGYRIAYDPAFYNIFLNVMSAAPNANVGSLCGPIGVFNAGCAFVGAEMYPGSGADARTFGQTALIPTGCANNACDPRYRNQTRVADDFRNPYTQQWSLGVQRQITPKIAAEVRYAGNHTIGNFMTFNANPQLATFDPAGNIIGGLAFDFPELLPPGVTPCMDFGADGIPGPGGTLTTDDAPGVGRIDCDDRIVRERRNRAFSIYHGLQNRLDFQNVAGITAGVAYTWSKTIDNASEIFTSINGNVSAPMNPFNPGEGERGESAHSFPHIFTTYWIYEFPMFKNQEGFIGHLLGGWQMSGTYRYQSGAPWTPRQQASVNAYCDPGFAGSFLGSDSGNCRPILGNPDAPLNAVGVCTDPTAPECAIVDMATGDPTTLNAVHWIQNDTAASLFFGSPFLGVGRNPLRGQPVNNLDFSMFKNTKITEKVTLQFQANAFNVLNRQYRGLPETRIRLAGDPADGGAFANNLFENSNRRYLIFGAKLIF